MMLIGHSKLGHRVLKYHNHKNVCKNVRLRIGPYISSPSRPNMQMMKRATSHKGFKGRSGMKLLVIVVVALLALAATIDGFETEFLTYKYVRTSHDNILSNKKKDKSPPPPPNHKSPPPPKTKSTPPPRANPPPPSPSAPDLSVWDANYINLYTPIPNGGLVISDDRMSAALRITSPNQTFGHFQSKYRFLHGYFSMYIKLIPNNSAGVVATYYFSSPQTSPDTHDEIDFEFLGNTTGNPVTLQTNVYIGGTGNREQRHDLPFDPTADFHKYSLLWNENLIIWSVDDQVIRVFYNISANTAVPYPYRKPMAIQASIWDGSAWATQGGLVKLNYSYSPFVATYKGFNGVDGCSACLATTCGDNPAVPSNCTSGGYWFDQQMMLTATQNSQLQSSRQTDLIYDYCADITRYPSGLPSECPYNNGTYNPVMFAESEITLVK